MPTYPFIPKDNAASTASPTINVTRKPKQSLEDEIIDRVSLQMPGRSREEIMEMIRVVDNHVIATLRSGTNIRMANGNIWSLAEDGCTIIITPPDHEP